MMCSQDLVPAGLVTGRGLPHIGFPKALLGNISFSSFSLFLPVSIPSLHSLKYSSIEIELQFIKFQMLPKLVSLSSLPNHPFWRITKPLLIGIQLADDRRME
jgi:hypothetical protein